MEPTTLRATGPRATEPFEVLRAAAAEFERAIARDPSDGAAHHGLGQLTRRLAHEHPGPASSAVLDHAYRLAGGEASLERFLAACYGSRADDVVVRSSPILVGAGSAHIVEHEITTGRGTDRVVQKITRNAGEVAALDALRRVQDRPPPGVRFPRVLAIERHPGLSHAFLERVEFRPGQLPRSGESSGRVAECYGAIPAILEPGSPSGELETVDLSARRLEQAVADIERSSAYAAAADRDPTVEQDLDRFARAAPAIAAELARATWVFSHNDTNLNNVMAERDGAGAVEGVLLLDWGRAGRNVAGADLYWYLLHRRLPEHRVDALVERYHRVASRWFPGCGRDEVLLGAIGYTVVRLALWVGGRSTRWWGRTEKLARVARLGRRAADLVGA